MARVIPFRGVRYNSEKISDLKDVTAPPHDVISPEAQQAFYSRHPQNVIRLILGAVHPSDNEHNNRYTRAAEFLTRWLDEKILLRDPEPALYLTETDYSIDGVPLTRTGFVALVEIEGYEKGGILPHEKTFSGTRTDRLRLLEACRANFNPVFSLYSDPEATVARAIRSALKGQAPVVAFGDSSGCDHRLWPVTDRSVHRAVEEMLTKRTLYIADGHHRYETALKYRNEALAGQPALSPNDPRNFIMMYLSSMHDPGLLIRPAHRLLRRPPKGDAGDFAGMFVQRARPYFDIDVLPFDGQSPKTIEEVFVGKIQANAARGAMGAAFPNHGAFYLLRLKQGTMERLFEQELHPSLRALDVTVATKLVLERIVGLSPDDLDDEQTIEYTSRREKAFQAVYSGRCALALILNPTRLGQMEAVSSAGLIMPRKSTYFYPKTVSGLVTYKMEL